MRRPIFILVFGSAVLVGAAATLLARGGVFSRATDAPPAALTVVTAPPSPAPPPPAPPKPAPLPAAVHLAVPFTVQAPSGNWGLPYQEACEEAAALTVHYFWQKKTFTPAIADQEIKALVAFEEDRYGFYKDTTLAETARFLRDRWDYRTTLTAFTSKTDALAKIKQALAHGTPVIVPAAGRLLHNPYYTPPGPLYHNLVLIGYTKDDRIITNDAGTKRGKDYLYDWDVLYAAIHDWNGGDVLHGAKRMLVARP